MLVGECSEMGCGQNVMRTIFSYGMIQKVFGDEYLVMWSARNLFLGHSKLCSTFSTTYIDDNRSYQKVNVHKIEGKIFVTRQQDHIFTILNHFRGTQLFNTLFVYKPGIILSFRTFIWSTIGVICGRLTLTYELKENFTTINFMFEKN